MSTVALEGSRRAAMGSNPAATVARNIDLLIVAVELALVITATGELAGYLVAVAAWLFGRAMKRAADERSKRSLAAGDRRAALRPQAIASISRVWIVTGAVLITGLIDRESGLAAALLAVALFTSHLLGLFVSQMLSSEESAA